MAIDDFKEFVAEEERNTEEIVIYNRSVEVARIGTLVDGTVRVAIDIQHSGSEKEMGEIMSLLYQLKTEYTYMTLLNRRAKRRVSSDEPYEEDLQEAGLQKPSDSDDFELSGDDQLGISSDEEREPPLEDNPTI